jgi:hypothetical protein
MQSPSQRLLESDLLSAEFRIGVEKGFLGQADVDVLPDGVVWPKIIFWMAAGVRANAPERFYVCIDAEGYRSVPPTGTFWDPATKTALDFGKRPKGEANSRFAKVFRTDWENGVAFYHPYDRKAAQSHPQWLSEQPHLIWTSNHTIVDYLEEFHSLLNSGDYVGV